MEAEATDSLGVEPDSAAVEVDGGPRRQQDSPIVNLLAIRTSVVTYDFTKAGKEGNRFIEAGLLEIEGWAVGVVGGGVPSGLRVPGELSDDEMAKRLAALGPVEILCTHVPPAVPQLQRDVVGGTQKGSQAVLEYLLEHRPRFHYFGDIHQPQAVNWVVGDTLCKNVGYFRATGRGVHHPAA